MSTVRPENALPGTDASADSEGDKRFDLPSRADASVSSTEKHQFTAGGRANPPDDEDDRESQSPVTTGGHTLAPEGPSNPVSKGMGLVATPTRKGILFISALLLLTGIWLLAPPGALNQIWEDIRNHPRAVAGFICLVVGGSLFGVLYPLELRAVLESVTFRVGATRADFADIDNRFRRRGTKTPAFTEQLASPPKLEEAVTKLREDSDQKTSISELATLVKSLREDFASSATTRRSAPESFSEYFAAIQQTLEDKSEKADLKASMALDHGKAYLKFGIGFYITSIVAWQILAALRGFHPALIYGIVSCSLLFVFVEFLSAWFLRQYRQFVDTSNYLMKVKSIFDRHMLTFLLIHEKAVRENANDAVTSALLDMLKADIKWPDTYLLKHPDVAFAREALESLAKVAKGVQRNSAERKKKEDK